MARRELFGFFASWVVSVVIGFFSGCIIVFFWMNANMQYFKGLALADKSTLEIMYFVGINSAFAASVVAFVTDVFLALPIYFLSKKYKYHSLSAYLLASFAISIMVCVILFLLERFIYRSSPVSGLLFPFVVIIITCPIAAFTLWVIVRPVIAALQSGNASYYKK